MQLQAVLFLIVCCYAHTHTKQVADQITDWFSTLELVYMKHFLENVKTDPERYSSLGITVTTIYIIVCILFIYGAYTCNNTLIIIYLIMELMRLVLLSMLIANLLLLLKQNTMDIGLLIGASVAGGFFLLGMFYLWVCAVNLPVLINEMQLDEQAATINKLQQLLDSSDQRSFANRTDMMPITAHGAFERNNMFVVSRNRAVHRHQS